MKKIVPLFDRVLVQRVKPQTKVGGIVLPESASQKTNEALVVSVGKGIHFLFFGWPHWPLVVHDDANSIDLFSRLLLCCFLFR
jgi:hypothetical protein